jgi:hypothetical protein
MTMSFVEFDHVVMTEAIEHVESTPQPALSGDALHRLDGCALSRRGRAYTFALVDK